MQQKIRKQSRMPKTKHVLVALAGKLELNLDCEPKPFRPTRNCPTPFTSALPGQSDTLVAISSHEDSRGKKVFGSYCKKKKNHKEVQCRKKSRNAKQREEARTNTTGAQIATVNESGSSNRRAKEKNFARRQ